MAIIQQVVLGAITGTFSKDGDMIGASQNVTINYIDSQTQEIVSVSYSQTYYDTKEDFLAAIGVS